VRGKLLAAVLLLAVVAGGSFLLGRTLFAHDAPVEAHLEPTDPCAASSGVEPTPIGAENLKPAPTPTPSAQATATPCLPPRNPTVAALSQQLEEEAARPRFVGVLNGFTFYGPGFDTAGLLRMKSPECTGTNSRQATEAEGLASSLSFTTTYLPPGTAKPNVFVNACGRDVITIGMDFNVPQALMTVYRTVGPALYEAQWPADRLQAATIGGRPAVVASPLSPPGKPSYTLLMRDDKSLWIIQGQGVPLDELRRVAEGVK
jgi:hypothetical protein